MRVLVVGGTDGYVGGVQSFVDAASGALEDCPGWSVARLSTNTAYVRVRDVGRVMLRTAKLAKTRSAGFDCVWVQYGNLPDLAFVLVARLAGFRVLVTPHLGMNWRSQSRWWLRGLSAALLRAAHRFALISPTQDLELPLPRRTPRSHIRSFLAEEKLNAPVELRSPADRLSLIHAARLSEGKGTFDFVHTCAALRDRGIEFSGVIAGEGSSETNRILARLVEDLGLAQHVSVVGRCSGEELTQRLLRSDVLLHLSRVDSYPLIVLESLTCACFPVCSDLLGARHMVETYDGGIVDPDAAVDSAAALLASLSVTDMRRRALAAAERVREDYARDTAASLIRKAVASCAADASLTNTGDSDAA